MKILYNLASLKKPRTGIGHYTQHIIDGVVRHPAITDVVGIMGSKVIARDALSKEDHDNEQVAPSFFKKIKKQIRPLLRSLPGIYRLRSCYQAYLSYSVRKRLAQQEFIYHETNFIPQPYKGKLVITVHDLSHIRYPEYHPRERVEHLNHYLSKALKRADKIITVSEFSRQELLDCFNIAPNKIITVLEGADSFFIPRAEEVVLSTLQKYRLKYRSYILSVCTLEPRKNLNRLLQAFALLPVELRRRYPIVLVGGQGWKNQDMLRLAEPLLKEQQLIFTGYVSQNELHQLYSAAKIFAYPSLYEGFGLPVLEAMASGVPVVTSNLSSLPEVSQGAGLEINPLAIEEISQALLRLIEDEKLAESCIAKGLERAKLLSWGSCVENTVKVYQSLQ